jgi:prevent-host-death family protein
MRIATVTEAKNQLSALIDAVKGGDSVLILDRGTPVARLERASGTERDAGGRLARLQRSGLVRAADEPAPTLPPPTAGARVLDALLDERREGR